MEQVFSVVDDARDGVTVVAVSGEVDVATAPALRERLNQVIERDQGPVVVDLLQVSFIDSTGLGVLVGALKRCREADRDLRVVVAEPRIQKVFDITGLTALFSLHDTVAAATA